MEQPDKTPRAEAQEELDKLRLRMMNLAAITRPLMRHAELQGIILAAKRRQRERLPLDILTSYRQLEEAARRYAVDEARKQ